MIPDTSHLEPTTSQPAESGSGAELPQPTVDAIDLQLQQHRLLEAMFGLTGDPTFLHHYIVLEKLGQGGMGVVYAAYDPTLDRKVAIKMLRDRGSAAEHRRLTKEAKAMAKLANPNVVQVYETDDYQGSAFIVMEYVDGVTLGEWLESTARSRAQILASFIEAGIGLIAAHEAGLVHRDFKPSNVMVRRDGRILVMDFGLARDGTDDEHATTADASVSRNRTGDNAGTLAYMSPEQHLGRRVDKRTDQFSFCVALWEALFGQRPFTGDNATQLAGAVVTGTLTEPASSGVPQWLRKVLRRGLELEVSERYESMEALLTALRTDPTVRRRRWLGAGLLGAASLGFVVGLLRWNAGVCAGMDTKLAGVWDDSRRAAVSEALLATKLPYAVDTWARVEPALDDYAAAWTSSRTEACEASRRGEQSGKLLDLRMICLDENLASLGVLVDELARADARVVERAVSAVSDLPSPERCSNAEVLRAQSPAPPPELAEAVAEQEQRLREARGKLATGQYAEGLELATAALEHARAIGYGRLTAEAYLTQGKLYDQLGRYEPAAESLEQALHGALAQEMTAQGAEAARELMWVVGHRMARYDTGHEYAKYANSLAQAGGTNEARAAYLYGVGIILVDEGEFPAAQEHFELALELWERELGPDHMWVEKANTALGIVTQRQGDLEASRAYALRALDSVERNLGDSHPRMAAMLSNLAVNAEYEGDHLANLHYSERALKLARSLYAAEHPVIASAQNNLGGALYHLQRHDEAIVAYDAALTSRIEHFGPEHPQTLNTLRNLGRVAVSTKRFEAARGYFERVLAAQTRVLGPHHPDVATTLREVASVAQHEQNYDVARASCSRALDIDLEALGSQSMGALLDSECLASLAEITGEHTLAREMFEDILERSKVVTAMTAPLVINTRNSLGRYAEMNGEYGEARNHHQAAQDVAKEFRGERSIAYADALCYVGGVAASEGKYDESKRACERALEIYEDLSLGESEDIYALTILGIAAKGKRDYRGARRYLGEVMKIEESIHGPNHPNTAGVLLNLGVVAFEEGKLPEARRLETRALEIIEAELGPEHIKVAGALTNLGVIAIAEHEYERARDHLERALALKREVWGTDHRALVSSMTGLGEARLELGDAHAAVDLLERARSIMQGKSKHLDAAYIDFLLARALVLRRPGSAASRRRAQTLAQQARAMFDDDSLPYEDELMEIDAWLASLGKG